jgi:hypothetical protein
MDLLLDEWMDGLIDCMREATLNNQSEPTLLDF